MLNCYFYARHKLKLVKICNLSVVYITIANCASIPACDQRERADNGAIATPYRARATRGSVGESERGGSRASKARVRAKRGCEQSEGADIGAVATPYRARATRGSVGGSERGGSRASGVNAVSGYVKHTAFYSLSIKNFVRFGPTFL